MNLIKELYDYRELLKTNIKKEIRGKYKGSLLGVLWSFINPLLQVLVYAIVFPYLMRGTSDNYLVYLITGIIPWTYFITVVNQGMTSIRSNAGIIKKVYFPREILPISVVISGLINFFISCVIILVFCIFSGLGVTWYIVFLPLIALIQTLLTLGLVFALSAINIYIKDVEYIFQFILNMLFYGTPIVYELALFNQSSNILVTLIKLNPLTQIIMSYRDIFIYHQVPNMFNLGIVSLVSVITCVIGYFIFKKLQKGFAEEL